MNLFAEAIQLHQRGLQHEARELCLKALQKDPGNAQVLTLLGTVNVLLGRRDEAIAALERASDRQPKYAPAHYMLGNLYREGGQLERAAARYRKAIACQPNFPDAYNNLGLTLGEIGKHDEELACYQHALNINPESQLAWYNLGNSLQKLGRYNDAVSCYERVLALLPEEPNSLFNMGNAQLAAGKLAAAIASYTKVVEKNPNYVAALGNLGVALKRAGNPAAALKVMTHVIELEPNNVPALVSLANAQAKLGNIPAALTNLQRAAELAPECADAYFNMGNLYHGSKQYTDAIQALETACRLQPESFLYRGSLIGCQMALWQMPSVENSWQSLMAKWEEGQRIPLDVLLERSDDLKVLRQGAEQYVNEWLRDSDMTLPMKIEKPRNGVHRTTYRIGYLSPDFGDHPVGMSLVEVLEAHDREKFEIVALSLIDHPGSSVGNRIARSCSQFVSLNGMSLDRAIDTTRQLDLDLLIDLAGYTANCQPLIPAARPARIQAAYLGFAGTTASPWIDYLIADQYVVPESSSNAYSERIAWLDTCFFPSDTTMAEPSLETDRDSEGLPREAFVFCCFNNARRITIEMMRLWMTLLRQTGDAVLWLGNASEVVSSNLRSFAAQCDIDPARLVFAGFAETRMQHLARHRLADLYLDTFPYNSHSTARDALYMGLPLVTLSGQSFASRVAGSLLTSLGLSELIASEADEYKHIAIELASQPKKLRDVRDRLANANSTMPLFKTGILVSNLEQAYVAMISRQRAGLVSANFRLEPDNTKWM